MKKVLFLALMSASSFKIFAQTNYAKSCGAGCDIVTAKSRMDKGCGGNNDYTYTIRNNSSSSLDISMYVEKLGGEWKDLGLRTNVEPGDDQKDAFWSCGLTGRYIFYYRIAGSKERFPYAKDLNNRAR